MSTYSFAQAIINWMRIAVLYRQMIRLQVTSSAAWTKPMML
jgi:hypothetical protein